MGESRLRPDHRKRHDIKRIQFISCSKIIATTTVSMRTIVVTYEHIRNVFHLPLPEAAKELGMGTTAFKRICRQHNISRWPYRKLKSIQKKADALKIKIERATSAHEKKNLLLELDYLYLQRSFVYNPSTAPTAAQTEKNKPTTSSTSPPSSSTTTPIAKPTSPVIPTLSLESSSPISSPLTSPRKNYSPINHTSTPSIDERQQIERLVQQRNATMSHNNYYYNTAASLGVSSFGVPNKFGNINNKPYYTKPREQTRLQLPAIVFENINLNRPHLMTLEPSPYSIARRAVFPTV